MSLKLAYDYQRAWLASNMCCFWEWENPIMAFSWYFEQQADPFCRSQIYSPLSMVVCSSSITAANQEVKQVLHVSNASGAKGLRPTKESTNITLVCGCGPLPHPQTVNLKNFYPWLSSSLHKRFHSFENSINTCATQRAKYYRVPV